MSDKAGEKTEQATPRKLDESIKRGQFARSGEVQTVFVLCAGLASLKLLGTELWSRLASAQIAIFSHLHELPLTLDSLPGHAAAAAGVLTVCVGPVLAATTGAGLLAGGIQTRFQTASEALACNWDRIDPIAGFKRLFSGRALMPAGVGMFKLGVIAALCWSQASAVLEDPIFFSAVDVARIAGFMADVAFGLSTRVLLALMLLAVGDYAYQYWRTAKDLMMTKEEVKEELKNSEGDPHMKARQRRRRGATSLRQMMLEVPKADVIVTNPTHLAVALRYDRKTMKAPRLIAKGSRLNALRIREIASQHQVPIVENKPLARMMFKHARVGGEIPAQLYAAVAEVLAYVYRVNRYRYYAEQNQR